MLKRIIFSEPEVATAYFAYSARLMSEIAQELGLSSDAEYYSNLSNKIKTAYLHVFLPRAKKMGAPQACYIRPLALGLIPQEDIPLIQNLLNQTLISGNYHVGTGFLSTPFLLEELSKAGYYDTAFKTLLQTSAPSWLYAVNQGAKTIWESWYGKKQDGTLRLSLNHYSYGAAVGWLFKFLAGIKWDLQIPGYKHFFLNPHPGGNLEFVKAEFDSPFGLIRSYWKKGNKDYNYQYEFEVPPNTTATVILLLEENNVLYYNGKHFCESELFRNVVKNTNYMQFNVGSGHYIFETKKSIKNMEEKN